MVLQMSDDTVRYCNHIAQRILGDLDETEYADFIKKAAQYADEARGSDWPICKEFELGYHMYELSFVAVPTAHLPTGASQSQRPVNIYGIDVTARREAEKQAREANLAKTNFLAQMSHELRTPLSGMISIIELLQNTHLSSDQCDLIELLHDNSKALMKIIGDILDFSRIEAGRIEVESISFVPAQVARSVVATFQALAASKSIHLGVQIDDEILEKKSYLGDPYRLRQILGNFLSNAVKFTPSGGQVTLLVQYNPNEEDKDVIDAQTCENIQKNSGNTDDETAEIQFCVIDTGIGFDDTFAANLFQPFRQAEASTTRRFGGTGLGLSICRGLAEKMNGRVWAESKIGKGSRFYVSLQMLAAAVAAAPVPAATVLRMDHTAFSHLQVMLCDDNPVNRKVISAQLRRLGVDPVVTNDGEDAVTQVLALYDDSPFNLVLMDMHMPVVDGMEATQRLRRLGIDTYIVGLTADASVEARDLCLQAGMNDVMSKPVSLSQLSGLLSQLPSSKPMAQVS